MYVIHGACSSYFVLVAFFMYSLQSASSAHTESYLPTAIAVLFHLAATLLFFPFGCVAD